MASERTFKFFNKMVEVNGNHPEHGGKCGRVIQEWQGSVTVMQENGVAFVVAIRDVAELVVVTGAVQ